MASGDDCVIQERTLKLNVSSQIRVPGIKMKTLISQV